MQVDRWMTWGDVMTLLVLLGLLIMVVILGDQRDMTRLSLRREIDGLREEVARVKRDNLPDVIVRRGSVYTGEGEIVIQGFNEKGEQGQ